MLVSWFLTLQDYAPDAVVLHEGVNDLHARFRKDFRADYSHWRTPLRPPPTNPVTRWLARWSDLYLYQRLEREGVPDIGGLTVAPGRQDEPLVAEGRLPPETARPFVRNVASIAASARELGATVVLLSLPTQPDHDPAIAPVWDYGVAENNRGLQDLAAQQGYLFVDAAGYFAEHVELVRPEFLDYVHLTGKGNSLKAELVADALAREWIPGLPAADTEPRR
jgi:lysophospholipase L1-like esterase